MEEILQQLQRQLQEAQLGQRELGVPQLQHIQQQREDAIPDGLVMHIVMISITTWTVAMMVETVVDVTLTHNTAQSADALIQMEVEQLAHRQQPSQLYQRLMTQVIMHYLETLLSSN